MEVELNIELSGPWKRPRLAFLLSSEIGKNNAKQRHSFNFAFEIHKATEGNIQRLTKVLGCSESDIQGLFEVYFAMKKLPPNHPKNCAKT